MLMVLVMIEMLMIGIMILHDMTQVDTYEQ